MHILMQTGGHLSPVEPTSQSASVRERKRDTETESSPERALVRARERVQGGKRERESDRQKPLCTLERFISCTVSSGQDASVPVTYDHSEGRVTHAATRCETEKEEGAVYWYSQCAFPVTITRIIATALALAAFWSEFILLPPLASLASIPFHSE